MSARKQGNPREPPFDIRIEREGKGVSWSRLPKIFSHKGTFWGQQVIMDVYV